MNAKASEFLKSICDISPVLAKALAQTIEYWSPEEPPATVAFAEIGHVLVDELETLDIGQQQAAFRIIEEGISSDNEELSTAVATGLIEGIVGRSAKRGNFDEIVGKLGASSQSHAKAWHG